VAGVHRRRVAGAPRIDLARVRDPAAVGRPHARVRSEEERSDLPGIAAARQIVEPQLRLLLASALRRDQELLPVRGPARVLPPAVAGELPRRTAGQRLEPEFLNATILPH